jgi:hypothetical protein
VLHALLLDVEPWCAAARTSKYFAPLSPPTTFRVACRLLCKYNLHQLVCRLVRQAQLRGHSSSWSEFWGELYIQYMKSATKYRSTTTPELVILKTLVVDAALAKLSMQYPQFTKTFDELIPQYRAAGMRGRNVDTVEGGAAGSVEGGGGAGGAADSAAGDGLAGAVAAEQGGGAGRGQQGGRGQGGGQGGGGEGGGGGQGGGGHGTGGQAEGGVDDERDTQLLLGSGKKLSAAESERVERSIRLRLTDVVWPALPGWHPVWLNMAAVLKYQHADQGGGGFTFKSAAYTRATQRVSYFAVARYIEDGEAVAYIARIHFFAKFTAAARQAAADAAHAAQQAADAHPPGPSSGGRGRGRGRRHAQANSAFEAAAQAARAAATAAAQEPPQALRVAFCDLYRARACATWRGTGYYVSDLSAPFKADVCIPLNELSEKVIACSRMYDRAAHQPAAASCIPAWFIPYANLSNTVAL